MSDSFTFEMSSTERPVNRFQVNPVSHKVNENIQVNVPQEVYRRLVNNDGETLEDDTFNEDATEILNKQNLQRTQRQSIKSSFRDKDKPSRFKDFQSQTTRFQVAPPNEEDSDDSSGSKEDRELLENEYDTKYGKSFRHFTREALPRLDNYRNIMSIQAAYRPTLDELHNATLTGKSASLNRNQDPEAANMNGVLKFGWIKGVLVRCLLNIWGVMLFLRLSWVVGQAGIIEGYILILTTTVVTCVTSLSMSAISTNGVIKGGGTYYMISRSLGPEFGGSIGMIFSLANAVACAMYVVGFCESMLDLLGSFGLSIIDGDVQDVRIIGCITISILLVIVVVGMEWEAKAQIGLLIILLVAIGDFIIGSIIGPKSEEEKAKGFIGYNATILKQNLFPDYRVENGVQHNFFSVIAIFFPAATGILAGANISGDLKDPQKSIPKGTLLAILISTATYLLMVFICGATVARDATGDVLDLVNGSYAFLNCTSARNPDDCQYGLQNSFQVIELVSGFGPLIYAGCFAATISSALASLVSAPKVFQALCKDELYPKIVWFAKGYGNNNEPVRGYVLTFIIAVAFILIGKLNLIAPLISNFFLAAYMLINFSTFHASLAKPVGWRPTFKYYNMWLSLVGSVLCVAVMFLISWVTALITFVAVLALYLIVAYRKPDVNWGSTTQAQTYKNALISVQQLNNVEEHVKNYRPQILVLSGLPNTRPVLVDFAYMLTKNLSLLVCGHVLRGSSSQRYRNYLQERATTWFRKHRVKGFYSLVDGEDFESGSRALMQACGIGKLKPNILLMGYKNDWQACDKKDLDQYFNVMHKALDMYLSVAILRLPNGLDCSQILGDESSAAKNVLDIPRTLQPNESSADLMSADRAVQNGLSGSMDSLSRNVSQDAGDLSNTGNGLKQLKSSSTSDLSFMAGSQVKEVSGLPDPVDPKSAQLLTNSLRKSKQKHNDPASLYKGPGGAELPKEILMELTQFTRKRGHAIIDVWWLYDDGGLTLLLPYIISTRRTWQSCKLRVYALANKKAELEFEQRSMASLLSKFRIDYSDLTLIPDITKKPQETSTTFFNELIKDFVSSDRDNGAPNAMPEDEAFISEDDLMAVQDKTNRYLRLREYLHEQSMKSDLVVMTLPMPRKNIVSAPLYMAWLESLSRDMPPFLFVRGNQTSVLTFYS
ncbi:bumetanide-sensitive sodium-(potassium)-chloride cotransporter isoform X1 [Anastrepha ludens]|uniref:bumetanide-sensitive sodium-(potassium)-chloride cotransporter isoform X1 n=1 Tax=Anastrepha ludens TaxID=28586 RepID=UPI0023B1C6B5|nr:bumetanide-sensitive sodium-(potassium)-chloride cotransporter isoform X1 [Anastrepha ludens]XP_053954949.1 bumetanide-sensitive sodium-(potassium)-chloride cotransporter isoform X1 [Anastrepha ludens]XP_053954950.1 bumetanide-sensitive sodium-(potassium)-chloride cotransporter isoform X1 [Anastrepha ludens]